MAFTAQDVKALRDATGAGMMDCKKALEANDGDIEAAKLWLREKGLAASANREDRDNAQGVVSLLIDGNVGAIVELKCETDFVAGSDQFKAEADALTELVLAKGTDAVAERATELEELKVTLKENIGLGDVVRIEAADGNVLESYHHIQGGRGVNAVLVEIAGGSVELAHDIAVHIAFARPKYLSRDDVPADVVDAEKATLDHHPERGQAGSGDRQDRRGSSERLLQGRGAARPALRERRQAVRHPGARESAKSRRVRRRSVDRLTDVARSPTR